MKIRYSRLRIVLFTFTLGLAAVSIHLRLSGYLNEIPVNLPQIESDAPIIIRLCPEWKSHKIYQVGGEVYFNKEKGMNCTPGGGGG